MILKLLILAILAVGISDALFLTPGQTTVVRGIGENAVFTCTNTDDASNVIPTWTDTVGVEIRPIGQGGSATLHVINYQAEKKAQLNILDIEESYEGTYGCAVGLDTDSRRLIVFEELQFPLKCPTGPNDPPCDGTEIDYQDDQELIIHEADRVECTVTGNPEPAVSWTFRGIPISDKDPRYTFQQTRDGKEITHILAIANVTRFDEGLFKCSASQLEQGVVDFLDITADVQEPPKIIIPPQDKNGTVGGSITLYCKAEGDPQPQYIWFRGGGEPLEDGEKYTIGDEDRELTIKNLVKNDQGDYTCMAENAAGIAQESGFLNVFIPPVMNPGQNETKSLNQMAELLCFKIQGEDDTWLRWRRGERWLTDGKQDFNERWEVFERLESGNPVKVLRITAITKEDEGPYTCWGENAGGEDQEKHWLLVEYKPIIDLENSHHQVDGWIGNESNLTCHWDAYPTPTVRWTKNGIPLKDGVNATIETELVIGGVITILYVTPSSLDFGPYECIAKNRLGEQTHNIIFNQVFAPEKPTNVRVIQSSITATTFVIELTDPEENGGLRIEGYQVGYHIEGFPEEYDDFNATEEIKVRGLTPSREYFYRVAAVNDVGVGDFSDNKTARTGDYSAPEAPVITSKATAINGNKYMLEWIEGDDNGGSIVTKFIIQYSEVTNGDKTELGPDPKEITVDKSAIAYTITELQPGSFYWIELYSENVFGISKPDGINIAMPGGIPLVPTTKYPGNKLPSISDDLSTAALIGIILGAFFILLILVDILCYFMNSCGFLMCICVHCCGKVPPDEKDDQEMGDGPLGYGNDLDRGKAYSEVTDTAMPLRHDSDDDSIVKPANGFSEGEEHLPGYRAVPRETQT